LNNITTNTDINTITIAETTTSVNAQTGQVCCWVVVEDVDEDNAAGDDDLMTFAFKRSGRTLGVPILCLLRFPAKEFWRELEDGKSLGRTARPTTCGCLPLTCLCLMESEGVRSGRVCLSVGRRLSGRATTFLTFLEFPRNRSRDWRGILSLMVCAEPGPTRPFCFCSSRGRLSCARGATSC